ncbi:MAG: hypothetical protein B7O98_07950 [Zestosphaera tikiterensis]|uniref:Glycosyltransferase RgtA/B/C/D-like domain-containing protein n=1 Tax=Zestosphaera tikiterensis TaxID=1973259 RepID=A0A2R7Y2Z0_9CREN|nr:MAG: hypothetical protein B7O98_07950 [Zestosphaera tikiterensis]
MDLSSLKRFEEVASTILWISLIIVVNYIASVFEVPTWVTVGRVTYRITAQPMVGDVDLMISTFLTIASLTPLIVKKVKDLTYVALLTVLTVLTYMYVFKLSLILYSITFSTALALTYVRLGFKKVVYGLLYAVVAFQLPSLIYYVSLMLGFKAVFLAGVSNFMIRFQALTWFLTPTSMVAYVVLLSLSKLKVVKPKDGVGGGLNGLSDSSKHPLRIYLIVGVVLSVLVGLITYLPTVNPYLIPTNVDWIHYYNALNRMARSEDYVSEAFKAWYSFGDRVAYMLLTYWLWRFLNVDLRVFAIYHNVLWLPLYTLSLYYLAKEVLGVERGKYVLLIAPFTPQTLSFLYGGYQADLLAVTLIYFSIALALKPKLWRACLAVAISTLALFTHVWSWTQYLIVLTAYLILTTPLTLKRRWRASLNLRFLLTLTLMTSVGAVIELIGVYRLHIYSSFDLLNTALKLLSRFKPSLKGYLSNLDFYLNIYTGGSLNNPIYYVASIASALTVGFTNDLISLNYLSFLAMTALSGVYAHRILVNTPTALALTTTLSYLEPNDRKALILCLITSFLSKALGFIPNLPLS